MDMCCVHVWVHLEAATTIYFSKTIHFISYRFTCIFFYFHQDLIDVYEKGVVVLGKEFDNIVKHICALVCVVKDREQVVVFTYLYC